MKRAIRFSFICICCLVSYVVDAQQYYAWQDTLYVRIADSAFVSDAIEFDLQIFRPNNNWEAKDTILGDADFCFNYNNAAFSPSSSITFKNVLPELQVGSFVELGGDFVADQWLIVKTVLTTPGAKMLSIPWREWITLCRVRIQYTAGASSNMPGIVWDKIATGAMTAGGRPVYLKLLGDVKKHPDPIINIEDWSPSIAQECEGEDVILYTTGNSSGDALKFDWEYKLPGTSSWTKIGSFDKPIDGSLTIRSKTVSYSISGIGDTIMFKSTSAALDSVFFHCILSDASLPNASAHTKTGPDIQLMLRDSVWGFLASTKGITHQLDTITKCPSSDNVTLRFYLFGFNSNPEYNAEMGSKIFFSYHAVDQLLISSPLDTITLPRTAASGTGGFAKIDGKVAYYWDVPMQVLPNTHIYIDEIWTEHCHNGSSAVGYDSVYIKEVSYENYDLAKLSVEPQKQVALTPVSVPYNTITISSKNPLGEIWDQGQQQDPNTGKPYQHYDYSAGANSGIDTVLYTYVKEGCTINVNREVEIVDKYYLTLRVLLQGPYAGLDVTGQDTMRCVDRGIFDSYTVQNGYYKSPYADSLFSKIKKMPTLEGGGTICDWIYILLRDGEDGVIVDSISAFVRQDGYLFNKEGKPYVTFTNLSKNSYYVIVKHRNHVPVMTKNLVKLMVITPTVLINGTDMTDENNIYGDNPLFVTRGIGMLYAGDIDGNHVITKTDENIVNSNSGLGYKYDIDHSKVVTSGDANYIGDNNGCAYRFPKVKNGL